MTAKEPLPVRVLTHNIRYATQSPFKGEELWEVRKPRLINELRYNTLYCTEAFICLQEVLHNQLMDIKYGLNGTQEPPRSSSQVAQWTYIGVGRDDGHQAGEYSPIFYQPSVWDLEMFKTVWLSKTPETPSKGWDAASIRILTIGKFQHRETKKSVIAMNTHLDDQGSKSRYEGAKVILQEIRSYTDQGPGKDPLAVFLAGDLNSEADQEAYQVLNDPKSLIEDLKDLTNPENRYGHDDTYTGFGYEEEPPKRIDFIFLGRREMLSSRDGGQARVQGGWAGKGYSVLESKFEDAVYISDHRAVVGDLLLD
ncbi:MAG: hypothetical protein M1830_008508 [Pleopsidium flavum]|nr:MAG: hypothetical protein M1830_008508 [Pleopsidium flavum]